MAGGDPAGGSVALASLIDRFGEELAFDFQHYLSLDLREVTRPGSPLTPRRALVFAKQLPMESATVAAMRGGPEYRGWDGDRYLLADAVDTLLSINHTEIRANSKTKPKPPPPVYRPGKDAPKKDTEGTFAATAKALANKRRAAKHDRTSRSPGGAGDGSGSPGHESVPDGAEAPTSD